MGWGRIQRLGLARRVEWRRQGAAAAEGFRRSRPGRRPQDASEGLPVGGIAHNLKVSSFVPVICPGPALKYHLAFTQESGPDRVGELLRLTDRDYTN